MALIKFGPGISLAELARRQKRYARLILREKRTEQRATLKSAKALQRAIEKEHRLSEKARKRELAVFKKIAPRFGVKVKRPGHGLKKQIQAFRPQIQQYREARAIRRRSPRQFIQAQIDAYTGKLRDMSKGHRGVENPHEMFLSLPREDQINIVREAEVLHAEWLANGGKTLGRRYNPLYAYH